jgi:hypothetical protein
MASNENDAQVNNAILTLVHRGRGHGPLGKKMILPKLEEESTLHPRKDPPPGYGQPGSAPPNYGSKGEAPITKEKPSGSEEAPVPDDKYKKPANFKLDPSYFMRKRAAAKKTGPTEVCIQQSRTYPL